MRNFRKVKQAYRKDTKLFDMKYGKIVDEVLNRMLLLSIKEDAVMKNFWENVILKDIQRIVMAA